MYSPLTHHDKVAILSRVGLAEAVADGYGRQGGNHVHDIQIRGVLRAVHEAGHQRHSQSSCTQDSGKRTNGHVRGGGGVPSATPAASSSLLHLLISDPRQLTSIHTCAV